MSRKIWIVLIVASLLIAMAIPASSAESNGKSPAGIEPYNGLFGADSPFYGLKLFLEKFDLSLEGNVSVKLQKQMAHGWQRLSEACAVAARNNPAALDAALAAYAEELQAINTTLDSEVIDDIIYLDAGEELQYQENSLVNMTNSTELPPAITDLYNRTLNTSQQIKNGRPFIWCNNTSYFVPPGQMKKISQGGEGKMPPGLAKKGYCSPEPIMINNTVIWPWDEQYSLYTNSSTNATDTMQSFEYVSKVLDKKGNGKANGKINGHGKK